MTKKEARGRLLLTRCGERGGKLFEAGDKREGKDSRKAPAAARTAEARREIE